MHASARFAVLIPLLVGPAVLSVAGGVASAQTQTAPVDHRNLSQRGERLAIKGYDPVAYFPEGGGKPQEGSPQITATHAGATYRFATQANRDRFLATPARYEPAHGGWCSWAMREGDKVEIDPASSIVRSDRLFLFYDGFWGDTRSKWLKKDHDAEAREADAQWKKISGEDARAMTLPATATSTPATEAPARAASDEANAQPALQTQLDDMARSFSSRTPPELQEVFEQGVRDVADSAVMSSALREGARAPEFSLPDASGKPVALAELLTRGPVVLTWYRGGWCPYCDVTLREYQRTIASTGAQLVAISPQTVDASLATAQENALMFPVLSDSGNQVASRYGLAYELPPALVRAFKGRLDLSEYNADDSNTLPLAATYVIGQDGVIHWAFVDADYRKRAEPRDVLRALETLKTPAPR